MTSSSDVLDRTRANGSPYPPPPGWKQSSRRPCPDRQVGAEHAHVQLLVGARARSRKRLGRASRTAGDSPTARTSRRRPGRRARTSFHAGRTSAASRPVRRDASRRRPSPARSGSSRRGPGRAAPGAPRAGSSRSWRTSSWRRRCPCARADRPSLPRARGTSRNRRPSCPGRPSSPPMTMLSRPVGPAMQRSGMSWMNAFRMRSPTAG